MSRREVLFLLDAQDGVLWSDVGNADELPDSRARWEAIWRLREALTQIAHSHPHGPLAFSGTDKTTMAALDFALGRPLRYWVVAPEGVITRKGEVVEIVDREPRWASRIRSESGIKRREV